MFSLDSAPTQLYYPLVLWDGVEGEGEELGMGTSLLHREEKLHFYWIEKYLSQVGSCLFSHIAPATMGDKYPFNNKNHKKKLATLLPPTPYPVTLMQGLLFDWLCCFRACFSHTGSMQNIDITCVSWHFLRLPKTVPKSPFEAYILKISSVICSVSSR